MYKKLLLLITALLTISNVFSQDLVKQSLFAPYGTPKKITISLPDGSEGITSFDRDGRVIRQESNNVILVYNWDKTDQGIFEIKTYFNNSYYQTQTINVRELSSSCIDMYLSTMTNKINFDAEGRITNTYVSATLENESREEYMYFHYNGDNKIPYKVVHKVNGYEEELEIELVECDNVGNPTEYTLSMNGQSMTMNRAIEYY